MQRVTGARVDVEGKTVGEISTGIAVLVAVEPEDDDRNMRRLLERLLAYRVFPDRSGRMNRSLTDIEGGLLLVPQFTLAADTRKGNRPSFTSAAPPELGKRLFEAMVERARDIHPGTASGIFGADMQVTLTNDGPVTFWLHVR